MKQLASRAQLGGGGGRIRAYRYVYRACVKPDIDCAKLYPRHSLVYISLNRPMH